MNRKPWFALTMMWSLLLVPVTEAGLYLFTTQAQGMHIPSRAVTILWVLGLYCVLGAYGVWKVRPWGFFLFLILVVGVFTGDLYQIVYLNGALTFWEILNVSLVALGLAFVLNKHVLTPYFNPRVRWWERSSRYKIDILATLATENQKAPAQLLDISASGCFLYTKNHLVLGDTVSLSIVLGETSFESSAKVIRHINEPEGFGLMFVKTTSKNRKAIKLIVRNLKDNSGFSLVELLIAIALIGMLATMASQAYQQFAGKARQGEAKVALTAMYTAETTFFAEHGSFTECLNQAGYNIKNVANRYYFSGFMAGDTGTCFGGAQSCAYYNLPASLDSCDLGCGSYDSLGANDGAYGPTLGANPSLPLANTCANQDALGLPYSWAAHSASFILGAAGSVSNSPLIDMWQIDNNRIITHFQNGL